MSQDRLPDAVVRYSDHRDGIIDLHVPADPNGTLLVLVHGGFWMEEWDRTHTRDQARALADLGYLVATPEYRRLRGEGGWPTTATDVLDAYAQLPDLLSGLGLEHSRTVTMGHSAGGHLVLWLAAQELIRPPDRTVALAPVCDLALAQTLGLGDGAVDELLDGTPLTAADPQTLHAGQPPGTVVILHGDRDHLVPIELGRSFATRHAWVELVELPGVGHFEFLDPRDPVWKTLASAVADGQTDPR
ncbi:acetyl esterase/lipase [Marmoricola sp. OAE513]|uniref:alpha/beta hydrolase n=1 Tax=Marmoricola sp. OAE513 TaxID=2817894 RepID=UPI001AEB2F77